MRIMRVVVLAVTVIAWVIAIGSFINSIADVAAFPDVARNILGLWPDPDTGLGAAVRFGAVGVVIAGILSYRYLGKVIERREQAPDHAARPIVAGS